MTADQDDAVLGSVNPGQCSFEIAVDRPFTGNRPAGRDRGPIPVDRSLRRRRNPRMPVKPDVIVRGKIDVSYVADQGFGTGDSVMHAKIRICDAEKIRSFSDHADLPETRKFRDIEPRGRDTAWIRAGAVPRTLRVSDRRRRR